MKDIREKLLGIFQGEHQDHSGQIRLLLQRIVAAETPGPDLDEAFRRAHSLKGAARAVGLDGIETVNHRLEALFARAREGSFRINQAAVEVIHDALDCSEDLLANSKGDQAAPDISPILGAIDGLLNAAVPPAAPRTVIEAPAEVLPEEEEDSASVDDRDVSASEASVRLRASHLDRLLRTCDQLGTAGPQHRAVTQSLHQLTNEIGRVIKRWERLRKSDVQQQSLGSGSNRSFHHSLDEMDSHLRSVATRSRRLLREQRRNALSLGRFSEDLRIDLWKARMTPASSVSDGLGSMVRELARSQQKQVRYRAVGLDTEADREVLQALREPVMHLLRNAVGHGLETPAERRQAGKPSAGQVTLSVEASAGLLTLRVADDGRGIDMGRVADEARRRGCLEASEPAQDHEQLRQLIFEPGFSTAAAVSELAGRGMGLSVVQETVRRLHGDVEARSQQGVGTEIVVRTPLSVLTQRILLVLAAGRTFAFTLRAVERVMSVAADHIETIEGRPAVRVGERLVPLASLAATLSLPTETPVQNKLSIVLLNHGLQAVAFSVDELLDQREALVKNLGMPEAARSFSAGGVLLDEGSIAILLNVGELLKGAQTSSVPSKEQANLPIKPSKPRILLADDSITTRALEKSILEVHGYEVLAAVDGVEALAMLRSHGADLVISDVQMPRMDGFELLEQIKNDKRLRHTPVIILTSLEQREEQEKGLALGADAYLMKRKFDQRELLETIQQII